MKNLIFFLSMIASLLGSAHTVKEIGIIFDCDGTLVDNEYFHFLSWKEAAAMQGADLSEEEFFPFFPGRHADEIARILSERYNLSCDALCRDKGNAYVRSVRQGMPPIERTVRFVRQLAERKKELGIKLAVASASRKENVLINLEKIGLKDVFDAVVSGKDDLGDYKDPEGVNKPKPYVYLQAAKMIGIDPSHCIAFEDTNTGIRAAHDAGMTTFAVPNAYTRRQDFSKASYFIDTQSEIDWDDFWKKVSVGRSDALRVLERD